jgi:hypothetical protein
MRTDYAIVLTAAVISLTAACRRVDGAATVVRAEPHADALARFRAGAAQPAELDGAVSREALIEQLVTALERSDTASFFRLALNRAEFAYFYYPTAREALPPYDLDPDLMWFVLNGRSRNDGFTALREFGGRPLGYVSHRCGEPRTEGRNTLWGYCRIERRLPTGQIEELALFGLIIERDGRFKFVSMANKLS